MKKISSISFALFYSLLIVGVGISTHYCLGQAKDTAVFSFDNHGCQCDGIMEGENDCCEDVEDFFVIEDDQTVVNTTNVSSPVFFVLYSFSYSVPAHIESYQYYQNESFINPPPIGEDARISICSLTYYG